MVEPPAKVEPVKPVAAPPVRSGPAKPEPKVEPEPVPQPVEVKKEAAAAPPQPTAILHDPDAEPAHPTDPEAENGTATEDDRWAGMDAIAWDGAAAADSGEVEDEDQEPATVARVVHKKPRAPRQPSNETEVADTRLTLEQALERIAPEARKFLAVQLKGEIRELRRYVPRG